MIFNDFKVLKHLVTSLNSEISKLENGIKLIEKINQLEKK